MVATRVKTVAENNFVMFTLQDGRSDLLAAICLSSVYLLAHPDKPVILGRVAGAVTPRPPAISHKSKLSAVPPCASIFPPSSRLYQKYRSFELLSLGNYLLSRLPPFAFGGYFLKYVGFGSILKGEKGGCWSAYIKKKNWFDTVKGDLKAQNLVTDLLHDYIVRIAVLLCHSQKAHKYYQYWKNEVVRGETTVHRMAFSLEQSISLNVRVRRNRKVSLIHKRAFRLTTGDTPKKRCKVDDEFTIVEFWEHIILVVMRIFLLDRLNTTWELLESLFILWHMMNP